MIYKIENISKLFDFANSTIYKWKKEKRLILDLFDKYFTDTDIEEFLETGKIQKQELIKNLNVEDLSNLSKEIIKQNNQNILKQMETLSNQLILDKGENCLLKIVKEFEEKDNNIADNSKDENANSKIRKNRQD